MYENLKFKKSINEITLKTSNLNTKVEPYYIFQDGRVFVFKNENNNIDFMHLSDGPYFEFGKKAPVYNQQPCVIFQNANNETQSFKLSGNFCTTTIYHTKVREVLGVFSTSYLGEIVNPAIKSKVPVFIEKQDDYFVCRVDFANVTVHSFFCCN